MGLSNTLFFIKTSYECLRKTLKTLGWRIHWLGGTSMWFYIFSQFRVFLTSFLFRQVPGLPQATAGSKKRCTKVNTSGIDGRIMDPVARRAAQRAAKGLRAREEDAAQPALTAVNVQVDVINCFHLLYFSKPYSRPSAVITMKSVIPALRLIHWHLRLFHRAGLQLDHLYGHP
jgi:hypothetical protein